MKNYVHFLFVITFCTAPYIAKAQDTTRYQLRLSIPVLDLPQNRDLPRRYPSMFQALEFSADLYELGYLGIDKLGNGLFKPKSKNYNTGRKIINGVFKYALSLGFVKYGSELPIPLGVWAHEEFHRAVLGVNGIGSKNGNWFPNRWDGTVYGVSDEQLSDLKRTSSNQLAYAYVAGIQSEVLLNRKISTEDFYKKRTLAKNALLLYNAWYVWDYFKFSASPASDSVKTWVSKNENPNPRQRDFAGADLTAWAYDMFSPEKPYTERDLFPAGEGVNRRIGFSELSEKAQDYLLKQKKLSLLNFVNPAMLFINRIPVGRHTFFNFFLQYAPTHFGNDISLMLPIQHRNTSLLLGLHKFSNLTAEGYGLDLGLYHRKWGRRFETDLLVNAWHQPQTFLTNEMIYGGALQIISRFDLFKKIGLALSVTGKTDGWQLGSPYLGSNLSGRFGLSYILK